MLGQLTTLLKPFNEITGLIGAILGIISLAAAIYFYYKSKFEKRPCFGVFSQTILSGAKSALKGLQVSFNGVLQDRVTISRIIFWNDGRDAIRRADISTSYPIRIVLAAQAQLLSSALYASTSEAAEARVVETKLGATSDHDSTVTIDFDFLNYRDGFVIDIVHNGPVDHRISLKGVVIGASPPKHYKLDSYGYAAGHWEFYRFVSVVLCFMVVVAVCGVIARTYGLTEAAVGPVVGKIVFAIGVVIGICAGVLGWRLCNYFAPSVPVKLRDAVSAGIRPLYDRFRDRAESTIPPQNS